MTEEEKYIIFLIENNFIKTLKSYINAIKIPDPFNFLITEGTYHNQTALGIAYILQHYEMAEYILEQFNFSNLRYVDNYTNIVTALPDIDTCPLDKVTTLIKKATTLLKKNQSFYLIFDVRDLNHLVKKLERHVSIEADLLRAQLKEYFSTFRSIMQDYLSVEQILNNQHSSQRVYSVEGIYNNNNNLIVVNQNTNTQPSSTSPPFFFSENNFSEEVLFEGTVSSNNNNNATKMATSQSNASDQDDLAKNYFNRLHQALANYYEEKMNTFSLNSKIHKKIKLPHTITGALECSSFDSFSNYLLRLKNSIPHARLVSQIGSMDENTYNEERKKYLTFIDSNRKRDDLSSYEKQFTEEIYSHLTCATLNTKFLVSKFPTHFK